MEITSELINRYYKYKHEQHIMNTYTEYAYVYNGKQCRGMKKLHEIIFLASEGYISNVELDEPTVRR